MDKRRMKMIKEEMMISHSYLVEKLDLLEERWSKEDERRKVMDSKKVGLCVVVAEDQGVRETEDQMVVWFKDTVMLGKFVTRGVSVLGKLALEDKKKRGRIVRKLKVLRDWIDLLLKRVEKQVEQEKRMDRIAMEIVEEIEEIKREEREGKR